MTAPGRRLAGLAAATALAASVAACSSGSPGSPSPTTTAQSTASQRAGSAAPLLVQCALDRGNASLAASAARDSKLLPRSQRFLNNGQLVLTSASAGAFNGWFQGHEAGVVMHGKSLDRWATDAAQSGRLPAAICGAGTSARQLYERVYAQSPTLRKSNPWN